MNTYNENLNTTVVNSLYNQEVALKTIQSVTNASMFTLYYAEGDTITAAEKLNVSQTELSEKTKVKTQAVNCTNMSNNQLAAATQANDYSQQSVTNTSVAAANVQTATNAIVKLAGDIGNIFSIVNAADFKTDIYDLTYEAKELINITAYNAEIASQHAMEASTAAAEVSMGAVNDKSTSTNTSMNSLLSVAETDYTNASDLVNTNNDALATTSAQEKLAEGAYLDNYVEELATDDAYTVMNLELNLNLTATPNEPYPTTITVSFDQITNPFDLKDQEPYYPVQDYYAVFVKDDRKSIFGLTNADVLLQDSSPALYPIELPLIPFPVPEDYEPSPISQNFDIYDADGNIQLIDSDGDALEFGVKYTVFVMAVYTDEYKWKINNYDNFLTAPSAYFTMLFELEAVDKNTIDVLAIDPNHQGEIDKYVRESIEITKDGVTDTISFGVEYLPAEDAQYEYRVLFDAPENHGFNVKYRCMFLLSDPEVANGMLVEGIKYRVQDLEQIADVYDPQIDNLNTQIANMNDLIQGLEDEIATKENDGESITEDKKTLTGYNKELTKLKNQLAKVEKEKEAVEGDMKEIEIPTPRVDFIFNAPIAEQVAAGNYSPSFPLLGIEADVKIKIGLDGIDLETDFSFPYQALIDDSTTDNFGNQLMCGKKYVPVILSISGEIDQEEFDKYESSISEFQMLEPFTYEPESCPTK